jgi:FMN phosphatase YigB (HAD superfamily)
MKSRVVIFDLDDTLFVRDSSIQENEDWENITSAEPSLGVVEFLHNFSGKKMLVTKESHPNLQNKKLELLGIRKLFDEVMICYKNKEKKELFSKIMCENPGDEIWVVGDRIDSEIRYGNELGLKTVLLNQGKYKTLKAKDDFEVSDYKIDKFIELNRILKCKQ